MTERSGALLEDPLYMIYCNIVAKSCGEEAEEGGDEEGDELASIHVSTEVHNILFCCLFVTKYYYIIYILTINLPTGLKMATDTESIRSGYGLMDTLFVRCHL